MPGARVVLDDLFVLRDARTVRPDDAGILFFRAVSVYHVFDRSGIEAHSSSIVLLFSDPDDGASPGSLPYQTLYRLI
jgi:hypothetical protein